MYRSIFQFGLCCIAIIILRVPLWPVNPLSNPKLFLIWILQACANILSTYSYICLMMYFSVGVSTVIFYISPIYSGVISYFVMKDPYRMWPDFTFALITLGGLALACYEEFAQLNVNSALDIILAILWFFIAPLSNALGALGLRMLDHSVHIIHPQIAAGIVGSVVGGILHVIPSEAPAEISSFSTGVWFCLIGIAVCSSIAMMFLHVSVQRISASLAVLLLSLEVPFVFLGEIIFFGQEASWSGLTGAAIVTIACACSSIFASDSSEEDAQNESSDIEKAESAQSEFPLSVQEIIPSDGQTKRSSFMSLRSDSRASLDNLRRRSFLAGAVPRLCDSDNSQSGIEEVSLKSLFSGIMIDQLSVKSGGISSSFVSANPAQSEHKSDLDDHNTKINQIFSE